MRLKREAEEEERQKQEAFAQIKADLEKQKAKTPDKNNLSKGSVGKMNERMSDWTRGGGGGGWNQQSRDHQGPSPWNFGWNNAGCKSSQMSQFLPRAFSFSPSKHFDIAAYHEGAWGGYYENYNHNNNPAAAAAYDNYHWGKYPTNNEGWGYKNNSRGHYRDYRQAATRHPYHRDQRPAAPAHHRGGADHRQFHRGGGTGGGGGGPVHNARRYLEQRRLQEAIDKTYFPCKPQFQDIFFGNHN